MQLLLLGGFLGSGKTTALVQACSLLMRQGKKVGVVTNDQGDQQVDSAFVRSFGIHTREVSNGCFCCNFNQLDEQLQDLQEKDMPDIIFAESVGSCTDLVATLVKPLQTQKPDLKIVVTIFVDASLASSLIEGRTTFLDDSVRYIYKKQMEEADLIILNKCDTVTPEQSSYTHKIIQSEYPGKIILHQNSLDEEDVKQWLKNQKDFPKDNKRQSLEIDYLTYGEGEAKLAWLDKQVEIQTIHADAVFVAHKIVGAIFNKIQARQLTIGHLKFFLNTESWNEKISFTTTSTGEHFKHKADIQTHSVSILINARVQTNPHTLKTLVDDVLFQAQKNYNCSITEQHWKVFSPGFPKPTHRVI